MEHVSTLRRHNSIIGKSGTTGLTVAASVFFVTVLLPDPRPLQIISDFAFQKALTRLWWLSPYLSKCLMLPYKYCIDMSSFSLLLERKSTIILLKIISLFNLNSQVCTFTQLTFLVYSFINISPPNSLCNVATYSISHQSSSGTLF